MTPSEKEKRRFELIKAMAPSALNVLFEDVKGLNIKNAAGMEDPEKIKREFLESIGGCAVMVVKMADELLLRMTPEEERKKEEGNQKSTTTP